MAKESIKRFIPIYTFLWYAIQNLTKILSYFSYYSNRTCVQSTRVHPCFIGVQVAQSIFLCFTRSFSKIFGQNKHNLHNLQNYKIHTKTVHIIIQLIIKCNSSPNLSPFKPKAISRYLGHFYCMTILNRGQGCRIKFVNFWTTCM